MNKVSRLLSWTAAALLSSSVAYAADLPAPVFVDEPELPKAEIGGGWYLRGDIGYKVYAEPNGGFADIDFYDEELDRTGVVGVGVGYRVNDYVRTDVTLDYEWDADFRGSSDCISECTGLTEPSNEFATVDVWTVLWNAYADLGYYNGFTPYVGAGVGASYVSAKDVHAVNSNGNRVNYSGGSKWNFSWALMAGMGYDINENWKIDAGYRYLHIGEAATKKFTDAGATASIKYKDLAAHEVRVGLRYEFGGASGASYDGYDEPIVAKY